MARIFSIQFLFNDHLQNAMISVRETPFHKEYCISMLDESLMSQLPSDKVISTGPEHFIFPNTPLHHYNELMQAIIKAISEHIHLLQH